MYGEKEIIISGNSLKTKKNFSPIFITSSKNFSAISATFSLSKKKKNKEKETRRDELGGVLYEKKRKEEEKKKKKKRDSLSWMKFSWFGSCHGT